MIKLIQNDYICLKYNIKCFMVQLLFNTILIINWSSEIKIEKNWIKSKKWECTLKHDVIYITYYIQIWKFIK